MNIRLNLLALGLSLILVQDAYAQPSTFDAAAKDELRTGLSFLATVIGISDVKMAVACGTGHGHIESGPMDLSNVRHPKMSFKCVTNPQDENDEDEPVGWIEYTVDLYAHKVVAVAMVIRGASMPEAEDLLAVVQELSLAKAWRQNLDLRARMRGEELVVEVRLAKK